MGSFFPALFKSWQSPGIEHAIERLVNEARRAEERRREPRYTFFRPVTVAASGRVVPGLRAFLREISRSGAGLLHNQPLERGTVEIKVRDDSNALICLATEIVWCRQCGDGWYVSGGRFQEVEYDFQANAQMLESRAL